MVVTHYEHDGIFCRRLLSFLSLWLMLFNLEAIKAFEIVKSPAKLCMQPSSHHMKERRLKAKFRFVTNEEVANVEATDNKENGRELIDEKALQALNTCTSGTQARRILENAIPKAVQKKNISGTVSNAASALYGSITIPPGASTKSLSDAELAIQTRLINKKYKIMDLIDLAGDGTSARTSSALFIVMATSTPMAILVNQSADVWSNVFGLPEILRFVVVWLLAFSPFFLLALGLQDSGQQLENRLVKLQSQLFPPFRKRLVQHEAGHFLMAHMLGWPIAGYHAGESDDFNVSRQKNPLQNAVMLYPLRDTDRGSDRARQLGFDDNAISRSSTRQAKMKAATESTTKSPSAFFGPYGRGSESVRDQSVFRHEQNSTRYDSFRRIPLGDDNPALAWPYRSLDEATVDQVTVIAVSGVCAELLAFGNAQGGRADWALLQQVFASTEEGNAVSGSDRIGYKNNNRVRFAIGYSISQLRLNLGVLDDLAAVMDKGGTIADCVLAIENCKDRSGQTRGYGESYETYRRVQFSPFASVANAFGGGVAPMESIIGGLAFLLIGEKSMQTEQIGEKGKKAQVRLGGDGPLYAAMAVATAFFLWAVNGGLSLH